MKYTHLFLKITLIIALIFTAYIHTIQSDFIWDDNDYITANPHLKTVNGLKNIWFKPGSTVQYYPLLFTFFWGQYQLWGFDVVGYHLFNIFIHIINVLLIWYLLTYLNVKGAFYAALIFAVHPVHVETVVWITELKNLLSTTFYLIALWTYMRFIPIHPQQISDKKKKLFYGFSFIFYVCALLTKTVTCSLPVVILLILYWKHQKIKKQDILSVTPYFVVGILFAFMTIWMEKHFAGVIVTPIDLSFLERLLIASRALWFYPSKLLWPADLIFIYPKWNVMANVWWQYLYVIATAGVIGLLFQLRHRLGRAPVVAVLFYVFTIFPALGFIDIETMQYTYVADHYQYLASLGFIIPFGFLLKRLFEKAKRPQFKILIMVIIVGALTFLSFNQGKNYKNLYVLWQKTIDKNPSCWLAYHNRGTMFLYDQQYDKALTDLDQALLLNPDLYQALNNRGTVYLNKGDLENSLRDFNRAISINATFHQAYKNRGDVYFRLQKIDSALDDYNQAISVNKDYEQAYNNRGVLYHKVGKYDAAISDFNKALVINPKYAKAYINRSYAHFMLGQFKEARENAQKAMALNFNVQKQYLDMLTQGKNK